MIILIGFLSPEGRFTKCRSWHHIYVAVDICKLAYKKEIGVNEAEMFLMERGYICFTEREVYMRDVAGIYITEKQLKYICKNRRNLENEDQNASLYELLKKHGLANIFYNSGEEGL